MSIATDIRSYADVAVSQGKQVLGQAQTQLNGVTGKTRENVFEIVGKAGSTVAELRVSAENAIKAVVEPYVAQAHGYRSAVTERAETLLATVKSDRRVGQFVDTAGAVTGVLVETVHERVIRPAQSLTGRAAKPATPAAPTKQSPSAAAKPANTTARTRSAAARPAATSKTSRPAATTRTTKPAARTAATTKPASKAAPRKAPARKSTES